MQEPRPQICKSSESIIGCMQGHRIHVPIDVDSSTLAFLSCPSAEPHSISARVTAQEAMRQGCVPLRIEEGLVSAGVHVCAAQPERHTSLNLQATSLKEPEQRQYNCICNPHVINMTRH